MTDDIEFEDPFGRWTGLDEFTAMLDYIGREVTDMTLTIHGEHHGPHEIVMDWTQSFGWLGFRMTFRCYTHILLEPPKKAGDPERIFRYFEEWNGNRLLSEKTVTPSFVGRVHQNLRRFTGYAAASAIKKGWL